MPLKHTERQDFFGTVHKRVCSDEKAVERIKPRVKRKTLEKPEEGQLLLEVTKKGKVILH